MLIYEDRNSGVVVTHDEQPAGRQIEARNVPVGLNQIAGSRAGQRGVKVSSADVGPAQIRTGQVGEIKVRSSRVGPAEVRIGEVSVCIVDDITIEIRIREVGMAEVCAGE